jgi:hypothetical protein
MKWPLPLFLGAVQVGAAVASSVCTKPPYDEILVLSKYPAAQSYCLQHYPHPSCISTKIETYPITSTVNLYSVVSIKTLTTGTTTATATTGTSTITVTTGTVTDSTAVGTDVSNVPHIAVTAADDADHY